MKKFFKKETPSYKTNAATTPYQKAKQEWDERIGVTAVQAKNWRFIAFLSLIISILLLIMLIISLSMDDSKVFVAQVTKTGQVVNVVPLQKAYTPTQAQEEYFVGQFISLAREIPLDPVLAKHNWLKAYGFLTERASVQLNKYFQKNDPTKNLGKQTVTVKINDINAVSKHSYHVDWIETTVNNSGQVTQTRNYSAVFTLTSTPPKTQKEILENPLGIYIVNFHISSRETLL